MSSTATRQSLGEFVVANALARYARPGLRVVNLGAGPGALRRRLNLFGCEIIAVDRDPAPYCGKHRFVTQTLNPSESASQVGIGSVHLVVALEVPFYPPNGYRLLRKLMAWAMRLAANSVPSHAVLGDHHIFVLKAAQ